MSEKTYHCDKYRPTSIKCFHRNTSLCNETDCSEYKPERFNCFMPFKIKLERKIEKHRELYYKGIPEISDTDYDKLEAELRKIKPESILFQKVGG